MNTKSLLSAFALAAFLSCQNQSEAPSAPQGETGTLALRVVSAKALAQVESVSVRLTWGADISIDRKAAWNAPSIKLDGLPLGVRIAVRMEGWNTLRGRKLVLWSGDTAVQLGGDADWDIAKAGAPILIQSRDSASIAAPNAGLLLPQGAVVVNDTLKRVLVGGGFDTIRLGTSGVDSVYVNGVKLGRKDSTQYQIVVGSGQVKTILVVGGNGMTTTFHVYAFTQIASSASVLAKTSSQASWNQDTVSYTLKEGAADTIRIDTTGVDSLVVGGSTRKASGASYVVVIDKPDTFVVVAKGANGQSKTFTVRVRAAEKVVVKPGLVASLGQLPEWIGPVCSLRVKIDSGEVDSVVLVHPAHEAFAPLGGTSWKLDWKTTGDSARLEIRVYGTGKDKRDSAIIPSTHRFDRKGPSIRIDGARVVGKAGGTLSWKAADERGVASSWATNLGTSSMTCPVDDSCRVTGLLRTFTVHAKDKLGNQTDSVVTIVADSVGPRIDTVLDGGTDKSLGKGDTLWVASDTAMANVRVVAQDSLSGFLIRAWQAGRSDTLVASSSNALSRLTKGTWNLFARDNLGNETSWGKLVVAVRVVVIETKPGLKAHLLPLPQWVGAFCSVQVVRDSGAIDSIVGEGVRIQPNGDKSVWSGSWTPSRSEGAGTLKLMVHGQGSNGRDSLVLTGVASIDRTGPTITLKSALRDGVLRVGKSGGKLAVSVQDPRGVDSVWLKGGAATIALAKDDTLYRATMTRTDTVMARDSLGNVNSLPVTVVMDSTAPGNVTLEDGLKRSLADSGYVHRDTVTGVAKLVVKATDSSGFLVRLMNGEILIRTVAGVNGVATLDSLPAGILTVVIEDSLGNTLVRDGKPTWGDVVVRIRPPAANKPAGTYGAEATKYVEFVEWVDALPIALTCPDGGTAYVKSHDDTASVAWQKGWTNIFGSAAYDFRCVKGTAPTDTSEIVTRTYNTLQRPWIKQNDTTFASSSLAIEIAPSSNATSNPAQAEIQYCLGDSLTCVAATWSPYKEPVVIRTSTTLWARISFEGKYSHVVKRTYTDADGVVNWTRNFALVNAPLVTDTAGLRRDYQIHAWSSQSFDTLTVKKTHNPDLRLDMKWLIANRARGSWGVFGADFFLDDSCSTYDFTDADSIVFDYTATGTMKALHIYPVDASAQGSDDALQYAATVTGTSHHVSIDLVKGTELKYPSWGNVSVEQQKTWDGIKGAIKSLRFFVEPTSTSADVPTEATTSLSISKVTIYGTIRKK